jgi:RimJ/RimL family protein N-acetyltransferase
MQKKISVIETERMQLICCDKEILEVVLKGDKAISKHLDLTVPVKWTEFGDRAFKYTYKKIIEGGHPQWWTYLPVYKGTRTLLGSCGFKGKPVKGVVEIGYEVAEGYRGCGLGTEMAMGLIQKAFANKQVKTVRAHTIPQENASCAILRKCGMKKVEELKDEDDGLIWKWEIFR